MKLQNWAASLLSVALLTGTIVAGVLVTAQNAQAQTATRVFEMRTYITHDGKLDDLQARFRNHTTKFFEKHGMTNVGYWVPRDQPNTLVYSISTSLVT